MSPKDKLQNKRLTQLSTAFVEGEVLPTPIPFGKYYLLEKIATGGMAEVFKAKRFGVEGFERLLAVKRILSAIAEDVDFISMFIDEAKIAGQLNHPNIAQIFDLGKAEESYFIAMEYVSGKHSRALFELFKNSDRQMDPDLACYIAIKTCEGLEYAHNRTDSLGEPLTIVHRDVSPQNIMISYEGEVKVIDFGIAKAAGKSSQTQVGILKGKFSYMSPEQVRGLPLDRRSDLFSLNIVLYELLTCKRLFLGGSDFETLEMIRKVDITPPSIINPNIPKALEDIVLKGLAKDPNHRFQSAVEMMETLSQFMADQSYQFGQRELAARMKTLFAEDLNLERQKWEHYKTLSEDNILSKQTFESPESLAWDDDEIETTVFDSDDSSQELAELIQGLDAPGQNVQPPPPPPSSDYAATTKPSDAWNQVADRLEADHSRHSSAYGHISAGHTPAHNQHVVVPRVRSSKLVTVLIVLTALLLGAGSALLIIRPWEASVDLHFDTDPRAVDILIDDEIIHSGTTPFFYQNARPGTYEITLIAEGYEPFTETRTFVEDGSYNIRQVLLPVEENNTDAPGADITIETTPEGVTVWIDGEDTGLTTPATIGGLNQGTHRLSLLHEGYVTIEEDLVLSNERLEISRVLYTEFRLIIRPEPVQAQFSLTVDGVDEVLHSGTGNVSLDGLNGSVAYRLLISADGYTPETLTLEPSAELTRTIDVTLLPTSEVEEAEIPITAEETGEDSVQDAPETDNEEPVTDEESLDETPVVENEETESSESEEEISREEPTAEEPTEENTDERETRRDEEREEVAEVAEVVVDSDAPGSLMIQSRPSSSAFIDGRFVGYTPVRNIELPPGQYRIRLVNDMFNLNHEETVIILPGGSERVIYRQEN